MGHLVRIVQTESSAVTIGAKHIRHSIKKIWNATKSESHLIGLCGVTQFKKEKLKLIIGGYGND